MRFVIMLALAAAIAPAAQFEVASIKPAANPEGRSLVQAQPGSLTMTNLSLRRLIFIAYNLQDYQLIGDAPWLASTTYDIYAKADGKTSVQQMEGPMLQGLLEQRFQLRLHRETRDLPLYELTAINSTKLQPSQEGTCTPYPKDAPPPPVTPDIPRLPFCGLHLTAQAAQRTLDGKGVSMDVLAANLSHTYNSNLGRNVIDKTGLTGTFDIHLKWTMDDLAAGDSASPAIGAALQDQLGLKLKSSKGLVEVIVIDHIERPSAN